VKAADPRGLEPPPHQHISKSALVISELAQVVMQI
jgi:hypothetical protein